MRHVDPLAVLFADVSEKDVRVVRDSSGQWCVDLRLDAGLADRDEEPALPDEARARAASESAAPTNQVESQPDQILHVRFGGAASDRLVLAMETFHALLRERPGATRVVLHVPAPSGGTALPMELSRRVAYDAELLAEVRRRLGEGLVGLTLG